ncbi:MAG: hypothetical protein HOP19_07895 [Acidobacteria bacterium]|nr:hypothetical protein [Acidobacteriota bacterium]
MHKLEFKTFYDYDLSQMDINVPVTLRSGSKSRELMAKFDPGSTFCVFQRIVGERLGFDIESGHLQWIGTATGRFLTYGHEVTLEVLGFSTTSIVYFAADEHFAVNVLGRVGFLNRTRIGLPVLA